MTTLDPAALREQFIAERGFWNETTEAMLDADPRFFRGYLDMSAHSARFGVLDPKVREFVLIAVDASATHLFVAGTRAHLKTALEIGATPGELMEVLELASAIGLQTCAVAVPILLEELAAAGQPLQRVPLTGREEEVKAELVARGIAWTPLWEDLVCLDAEFAATFAAFASVPMEHGSLEPKVRELVLLALDASATHLHEPGIREHIRNALALGATKEEIMEVLELTSILGIHTSLVAAPLLRDLLVAR